MVKFLDIACLILLSAVYIILLVVSWSFMSNYLDNKLIALLIPCFIVVYGIFVRETYPLLRGLWGEIKDKENIN